MIRGSTNLIRMDADPCTQTPVASIWARMIAELAAIPLPRAVPQRLLERL